MKLNTVYTHPRWLTAQAKLNDLNAEASKLHSRAGELEGIIAASPSSHSASLEALELLGDALDGGHVSALQAGKSARAELVELRKRLATVEQAVKLLDLRMHRGDGDHCSFAAELSRDCNREAGPQFVARMRDVLTAAQALKAALESASAIPQTLTRGGGSISDPIRLEYGPFAGIDQPDNNVMTLWLNELAKYIRNNEQPAKAA